MRILTDIHLQLGLHGWMLSQQVIIIKDIILQASSQGMT